MSALAKVEGGALARADGGLTQEQVELVKRTIAKGATNDELALFISTANRLRLDPFARQIFLVKRWDSQVNGYVATPQVSVDGFRLVAERTGQYRGQTAPEWCGKDGKWTDVWLSDQPPAAARVGVFREGFAQPLVRVALYKSYAQTKKDGSPNAMWAKYPEVMLAKCAESLALRSAFPNELSGIYTSDELPAEQEQQPRERLPAKTTEERLDAIARGGERAETRPTDADSAKQNSTPGGATDAAQPSNTANASSDGELLDAKAWRDKYASICVEAADAGCTFLGEDENGIAEPAWPCPTFPKDAKRFGGMRYDDPKCVGFIRKTAQEPGFGEKELVKRLWALRAIAVHETKKEEAGDG